MVRRSELEIARLNDVSESIRDGYNRRTYLATQSKALAKSGVDLSVSGVMASMVAEAAMASSGATSEVLAQIGVFYDAAVRSRRPSLANAYEDVGKQANIAVSQRYRKSAGRGGPGPYRANASGKYKRDSGGKLGRALTSERMYLATPTGISYVNRPFLDSQARQWYRLNFGAGQRGRDSVRPASRTAIFFGQRTSLDIGLQGFSASPSFKMPAGFFQDSRGTVKGFDPSRRGKDKFNPAGFLQGGQNMMKNAAGQELRAITTQGITARNFLDAGTDVIARGMPLVTTEFLRGVLEEAFASGGSKGVVSASALDTKDIERALKRTQLEIEKLPRQAKALSSSVSRRF